MAEHDNIFKWVFRIPAHAAGELAAVLPKNLLEAIDLGSLELVQGDFVSRQLNERFTDALFSARFYGTHGYVWFLLEHQSKPDRWLLLRLLEYVVRAWSDHLRRQPSLERLPPIVCVVVHHGESGWNVPTRLQQLVDGVSRVPALARLVPDFEIIVDDLVTQSDEQLLRRPLASFPKVVLWVLRDARTIRRLYEHLSTWANELDRLAGDAPEDAATVLRYILTVAGDEPLELIRRRIIEAAPSTEYPMASAAEQLIQQGKVLGRAEGEAKGRAEGEAKGRAEGEAEGRAKGRAEGILKVLQARGFNLSDAQRQRILTCTDLALLDRWFDRALNAPSAEELFD